MSADKEIAFESWEVFETVKPDLTELEMAQLEVQRANRACAEANRKLHAAKERLFYAEDYEARRKGSL